MAQKTPISTALPQERVILVGVDRGRAGDWPLDRSMEELARLVETDGGLVVGDMTQRLDRPVPKTFIGSGKVGELRDLTVGLGADVVVFDDELSPSQQANLERALGEDVKVIDRTALILDIFGRHAATKEGRLQVQEAQLSYVLPRLRGMWSHLMGEQTRGGIGSRFGQGESQLEVDRRLVRSRLAQLRKELDRVQTQRETQSKARWDSGVYRVAFAGYTNAGKSTLLNALTGSEVYAQDELFATLDPTTRSLDLAEGRKITLTDTVGFIQKIPTKLVQSFKSTLAEVRSADLVLLVVDASDENWPAQVKAVEETLESIDAKDIERVLVLNKVDLLSREDREHLALAHPEAVLVSAKEGTGLDALLHRVAQEAAKDDVLMTAKIPFAKGLLTKAVHEQGQIVHESYEPDGLLITARVPHRLAGHLAPYEVPEEATSEPEQGEEA